MFYAFTSGLIGLAPPLAVRGMGATASPAQVQAMIVQAAQAQGVPPNLALGIASHESGFNASAVNQNTNSQGQPTTKDYGVMQLNDSVLQTYGISPTAALDPQTNIDTGVSLLASLLQKYNGNQQMALWAYAQGAGTVANSPGGPNSSAQSFINYVQSFDPSNILASIGMSDTGTSLSDTFGSAADSLNATVAGIDLTDPSTLLVGLGLVLGLVWLGRNV
jgi:soluble lytic murein transglycosylase-like protein